MKCDQTFNSLYFLAALALALGIGVLTTINRPQDLGAVTPVIIAIAATAGWTGRSARNPR
jgi:hypothetical protein